MVRGRVRQSRVQPYGDVAEAPERAVSDTRMTVFPASIETPCLLLRTWTLHTASAAVVRRLAYTHRETIPNDTVKPDGTPRDTMVWEMTAPGMSR